MRTPPKLPYCGMTIIMSHPSRFDDTALLSGWAGEMFTRALAPIHPLTCDVRTLDEKAPLLPATSVIFLLGEDALQAFNYNKDETLGLNQLRGCPWQLAPQAPIFIASYLPQDATDAKAAYELEHNRHLHKYDSSDSSEGDSPSSGDKDETTADEKSTKGKTARGNYRFWLIQDTQKAVRLLQASKRGECLSSFTGVEAVYRIYPSLTELLPVMYNGSNKVAYLDIETDCAETMTVFSINFDDSNEVWIVPIIDYRRELCYGPLYLAKILRALAHVFATCEVVTHNGSVFDLVFLAHYYHIPPPRRNYDTMLAHARLFPGVEKSLGHCISLYLYDPYHKNEGIFNPHNTQQQEQLWLYNGKDTWETKKLRVAQEKEAITKHAVDSIAQVNASVYAYTVMTLTGIAYNKAKLEERLAANDRRMTQMLRVLRTLVGHELLPTSNKSCVTYFHKELGLKVQKKTKAGNTSLDEKAMYKLYVANDHPVIPVALEYRRLAKETSSFLRFVPFREVEGVTTDERETTM